jgi:hypothetical protein
MEYSRENVMSPQELSKEFGISLSRLADLRSQGKGPPYFKFGGIWYPKNGFDSWIHKQMKGDNKNVAEKKGRQLALPVRVQEPGVHGQYRFGRHATK